MELQPPAGTRQRLKPGHAGTSLMPTARPGTLEPLPPRRLGQGA